MRQHMCMFKNVPNIRNPRTTYLEKLAPDPGCDLLSPQLIYRWNRPQYLTNQRTVINATNFGTPWEKSRPLTSEHCVEIKATNVQHCGKINATNVGTSWENQSHKCRNSVVKELWRSVLPWQIYWGCSTGEYYQPRDASIMARSDVQIQCKVCWYIHAACVIHV